MNTKRLLLSSFLSSVPACTLTCGARGDGGSLPVCADEELLALGPRQHEGAVVVVGAVAVVPGLLSGEAPAWPGEGIFIQRSCTTPRKYSFTLVSAVLSLPCAKSSSKPSSQGMVGVSMLPTAQGSMRWAQVAVWQCCQYVCQLGLQRIYVQKYDPVVWHLATFARGWCFKTLCKTDNKRTLSARRPFTASRWP
jgi:hypothetical protein